MHAILTMDIVTPYPGKSVQNEGTFMNQYMQLAIEEARAAQAGGD